MSVSVGNRVDARIIGLQQTIVLDAIAGKRVVRKGHGQSQIGLLRTPAKFARIPAGHRRANRSAIRIRGMRCRRRYQLNPVALPPPHSASTRLPSAAAVQELVRSMPGLVTPSLVVTDIEPPSVLSPNTGFDPGISVISEIGVALDQVPTDHVAERLILPHAIAHTPRVPPACRAAAKRYSRGNSRRAGMGCPAFRSRTRR